MNMGKYQEKHSTSSFQRIKYKGVRFLATICPMEEAMPLYLQVLESYNVTTLVRINGDLYDTTDLIAAGIEVYDLKYDSAYPPADVIKIWSEIVNDHLELQAKTTVAVHCSLHRFRSPLLIALGLTQLGMKSCKAIKMLQSRGIGSIYHDQITWLKLYTKKIRNAKKEYKLSLLQD